MSDKICCCNVVTGAGVVTSLQLILLLLCLSSSGIILDRYRIWAGTEPRNIVNETEKAEAAAKGETLNILPTRWGKAVMEIGMAWYTAFACFWLFSLLILCLSFKYYRPVFVIPNCTALLIGIFMHLLGFGVLLGCILSKSKNYQTTNYEDDILIIVTGLLLFTFFINFLFMVFIFKYHTFLRQRYGHQVPKFVTSRGRTGYPEEQY